MTEILAEKIADLQEEEVLEIVNRELEAGTDALKILETSQKGLDLVGERYSKGIYYLPELMMAGEILKQVSVILAPHFKGGSVATGGKVIMGTVKDDIHNIGKDLVVGMLHSASYDVTDLGVDVPAERFIRTVKETGATVLGLSGLLTIAFDSMKNTIKALEACGLRSKVKVMIGGGPVNEKVCKYTGADAWGNNPQIAVKLCKEWISKKRC